MEMNVRKNRNGVTGDKISYLWDIDTGKFTYVENDENDDSPVAQHSTSSQDDTPPWSTQSAPEYRDGTEVF